MVNSIDPLLRPQVTQMLMDLLSSRASAPSAPRAAVPAPVPTPPPMPPVSAMVQPNPSQAKKPAVPSPKVAVPNTSNTKPSAVKPPESKAVSRVEVPKSMPKSMNGSKVNPMKPAETNSHPAKTREVAGPPRAPAQLAVAGPKSPLLEAVEAGDLGCVTKLLNGRAEPNEYDRQGETPLFTAASHGSVDVVATLLLCNAEPLTRSIHGRTPWDVASSEPIRSLLNFFAGQVS